MRKILFHKTVAFTAAVVMTCCGFGQTGLSGLASSVQQSSISVSELQRTDTDPVSVIIVLNSDAILDGNKSPEYLATADAAAESDVVLRSQDAVIAQIREWYPELVLRYRYTTLVNGFACSLPANLIGKVSALPEVESVTQTGKLQVKKEMTTAAALANILYFQSESGCAGEGQAIAVIDSEIDVTHPMFAPLADNLRKKICKSDLDAIASGIGFNTDFDTDQAYISSKVPFAIDCSDKQDPYSIADPGVYHGTHVCGIAAGNRITDSEGVAISGVAPDAQIVFMGMMESGGDLEAVLIAEIEDAVKLNVDAINISLGWDGDPMGQSALSEAINQAEAAGITVCIGAGNSGNGVMSYGETHYADNPDVSWMNYFISEGSKAITVAAANNTPTADFYCFTLNREPIPYEVYFDPNTSESHYLYNSLDPDQDYEYVYCGYGRVQDFTENMDLTGKIALIDRGENNFSDKASNARMNGAVAAIIIQSDDSDPIVMTSSDPLPIGMIHYQNGEILKNAENKVIRFPDTMIRVHRTNGVSSYTSWGIQSTMELRPDITAVGTSVLSAAYNQELHLNSGTSMATPFMTGCSAILKQYLMENGCTLRGSELARYMRNLLMTTALPYRFKDMYITPRRQGAGLVQMDAALKSKVILTGAEGESKLSLRDKLGTQFSFPLTLTNFSNEDVLFTDARIELTTDDTKYDIESKRYEIEGQQPLFCSASLENLTQISAGESRTEMVTVSLNAAQFEEMKKIFTNGFFIEGYIVLEGAKNCADISIPLVGFSDNFAQIPIFVDDYKWLAQVSSWTATPVNIPFCESLDILLGGLNRAEQINAKKQDELIPTALLQLSADELERMNRNPEALYCSPNCDGLADMIALFAKVQRNCLVTGLQVLDQNGTIVADSLENTRKSKLPSDSVGTYQVAHMREKLKEGKYSIRLCASIYRNPTEEDIQVIECPLYVDEKKPVMVSEEKNQNGRKTVSLNVKDENAMDGVIVLGKGDGHIVAKDTQYRKIPKNTTMDLAQAFMSYQGYLIDTPPYYEADQDMLHPFFQFLTNYSTTENSLFQRYYLNDYDYAEFIPASESSKEMTLEYDVTDLSRYEFLAIDRAFNVCELSDVNEPVRPNSIEPGVYQTDAGIYVITEDMIHFIPAIEYYASTYHYTVSNGKLTLIGDMEDSYQPGEYKMNVSVQEDESLCIRGLNYKLLGTFFYDDPYEQILKPVDIEDPEHYYAIHGIELEAQYLEPYVRSITGHQGIITSYYTFQPDGVVVFNMECYDHSMIVNTISITVDLKTGIGTLEDGTTIDFLRTKTGDVDCDGSVDVGDAVLLARMLAEDCEAEISKVGKINADTDYNGSLTSNDVVMILRAIAKLITLY